MVYVEVDMRIEFRHGVPEGCRDWLLKNIGPLNDTWYYARIPIGEWYVPCIVIDDEKKAVWFRLRWA